MIYLIYGDDHYRVREYVQAIGQAAQKAALTTVQLDAVDCQPATLLEHLSQDSLFSRKRAVFVKNLLTGGQADLRDVASERISKLPEGLTIVLWEEGVPDRRLRLFSSLIKRARVIERQPLKGQALTQWIRARADKKGVRIDREAAELLAQTVDSDLERADNELEKLALYRGKRQVGVDDIKSLTDPGIPTVVFDLLDALGNPLRSHMLVEQLLTQGQDPLYLLSMLAYQIRNLLLTRDLVDRTSNVTPFAIARTLGMHPFVAEKTLAQARRFSFSTLRKLHAALTEADTAIKTGAVDAPDALTLFVTGRSPRLAAFGSF